MLGTSRTQTNGMFLNLIIFVILYFYIMSMSTYIAAGFIIVVLFAVFVFKLLHNECFDQSFYWKFIVYRLCVTNIENFWFVFTLSSHFLSPDWVIKSNDVLNVTNLKNQLTGFFWWNAAFSTTPHVANPIHYTF